MVYAVIVKQNSLNQKEEKLLNQFCISYLGSRTQIDLIDTQSQNYNSYRYTTN